MDQDLEIVREIGGHLRRTLEQERELQRQYDEKEKQHKDALARERALQTLEAEALTRRLQRRAQDIAKNAEAVSKGLNGGCSIDTSSSTRRSTQEAAATGSRADSSAAAKSSTKNKTKIKITTMTQNASG